jgi:hypothetical protein
MAVLLRGHPHANIGVWLMLAITIWSGRIMPSSIGAS